MSEITIERDGIKIHIVLPNDFKDVDCIEVLQDTLKAVTGMNYDVSIP